MKAEAEASPKCRHMIIQSPGYHGDWFQMASATKALRFGPAIKEVRLHLCQKSAASAGAREFVEKHYVPLKLANPK